MWVLYALTAAVFFAVVHLLDEYCIDEIFEKPWIGVITSALASLVVLIPLPFILPFVGWQWPTYSILLLAISAGALIQVSQLLYFNALANTNAGIVAAYWNIIPAILPILSYFIFGRIFTPNQYIGIVILIFSSNLIALAFAQKSIKEGSPSLVAAVETTMPGFTFLIALIVFSIFKIKYDTKIFMNIWKKYMALIVMIIGVYLVS